MFQWIHFKFASCQIVINVAELHCRSWLRPKQIEESRENEMSNWSECWLINETQRAHTQGDTEDRKCHWHRHMQNCTSQWHQCAMCMESDRQGIRPQRHWTHFHHNEIEHETYIRVTELDTRAIRGAVNSDSIVFCICFAPHWAAKCHCQCNMCYGYFWHHTVRAAYAIVPCVFVFSFHDLFHDENGEISVKRERRMTYAVPIWIFRCVSVPTKNKNQRQQKTTFTKKFHMRQLFTSAAYRREKENERPQTVGCYWHLYVQNTRVPYNFFVYDDDCRWLIGDVSNTP